MEYTLIHQICAIWIVLSFLWGKIYIGMNIGKRFGDVKISPWRLQTGFVLFQQIAGVFIVVGTGFFYEWYWPQIVWTILASAGSVIIVTTLPLIRRGDVQNSIITYKFHDFIGDAVSLVLYYFGHAYGPLGLNPWPL